MPKLRGISSRRVDRARLASGEMVGSERILGAPAMRRGLPESTRRAEGVVNRGARSEVGEVLLYPGTGLRPRATQFPIAAAMLDRETDMERMSEIAAVSLRQVDPKSDAKLEAEDFRPAVRNFEAAPPVRPVC